MGLANHHTNMQEEKEESTTSMLSRTLEDFNEVDETKPRQDHEVLQLDA